MIDQEQIKLASSSGPPNEWLVATGGRRPGEGFTDHGITSCP